MNCRILLAALLLYIPVVSSAQKTLTASGDYTFYGPTDITPEQAKLIALERAKAQIIADNFGTVVGVNNSTFTENRGGQGSVTFLSLGDSEIKGEWLETIGDPVFSITYESNFQVVKVHLTGKIRELSTARIQFASSILRNGTSDKFESDEFRAGDDIYVSFTSPVSGYVAIFLYDRNGISRLLPLKYQKDGSFKVESGERYVFFEKRSKIYSAKENRYVENTFSEYVLTCIGEMEINRLYVVFSPNKFARPLDNVSFEHEDMPASLSFEAFQKWLSKSRRQDVDMSVKITDIVVRQRNGE